jgi:hypothetical protein
MTYGSVQSLNKSLNSFGLAQHYLKLASNCSPILEKSLKKYGGRSVDSFLNTFQHNTGESYQDREDFYQIVYKYISSLLGEELALRTTRDLAKAPTILTANHHGVDYFAQSVQSSLLFSLILTRQNPDASTIPVFACGNVPLNNLTYPRGLMIYFLNPDNIDKMPLKIPIFNDRMKRMVVSAAQPFDTLMAQRAVKRVGNLIKDLKISPTLADPLNSILNEDYSDPYILQLDSYSQQSVVLNHRIWQRIFQKSSKHLDLVYLELEEIASKLLNIDLQNTNSLAWAIMFDPQVREKVLIGLDGSKACWQNLKLAGRHNFDFLNYKKAKRFESCGTHFFWGIDSYDKRIPLCLEGNRWQNPVLKGKDDRGKIWSFPFNPKSIIKSLNEKRLSPSLFTSYLTMSLARGLTCVGGYYQSEYLPAMQRGVVRALKGTPGYETCALLVEKVDTTSYLSGMQTVMTLIDKGALIPAGPIEIIAGGGLQMEELEQLVSLTVEEAHVASLFDTMQDVAPLEAKKGGWKKALSREYYQLLKERIVVHENKCAA